MTFKQAKELSILKWDWLSKHGRLKKELVGTHYKRLLKAIPKLKRYGNYSNCGFCAYYLSDCLKCPLDCISLYETWQDCEDNNLSKALAKQILADIKECEK